MHQGGIVILVYGSGILPFFDFVISSYPPDAFGNLDCSLTGKFISRGRMLEVIIPIEQLCIQCNISPLFPTLKSLTYPVFP